MLPRKKKKTNQYLFHQKMFGMKCKTKTILVSIDKYVFG